MWLLLLGAIADEGDEREARTDVVVADGGCGRGTDRMRALPAAAVTDGGICCHEAGDVMKLCDSDTDDGGAADCVSAAAVFEDCGAIDAICATLSLLGKWTSGWKNCVGGETTI